MKKTKRLLLLSLIIILIITLPIALSFREKLKLDDSLRQRSENEFVLLSGGYTEYELGGDPGGIPVVLIHGVSIAMYEWDRQFEYLVSHGYRVLRYNQFGRGLSDRPSNEYNRLFYITQLDEIIDLFFNEKVNFYCPCSQSGKKQ